MFSWRRKPKPQEPVPVPQVKPASGTKACFGFANGERSWTEEVDLVESAARVLKQKGHRVIARDDWLEHPDSGLLLRPKLLGMKPIHPVGAQTTTIIEVARRGLLPPNVYEYQHSAGTSVEDSVCKGFDQWCDIDLPVFLDALADKPAHCMTLVMEFPQSESHPPRKRRVVLGPVGQIPAPAARADACKNADPSEHSFCACCMLTRNWEAFKPMIEGDGFYGIRLYAARDQTGGAQADCRVNGEDFEPGAIALRKYVESWPQIGFELRKQYVAIQTIDGGLQ